MWFPSLVYNGVRNGKLSQGEMQHNIERLSSGRLARNVRGVSTLVKLSLPDVKLITRSGQGMGFVVRSICHTLNVVILPKTD